MKQKTQEFFEKLKGNLSRNEPGLMSFAFILDFRERDIPDEEHCYSIDFNGMQMEAAVLTICHILARTVESSGEMTLPEALRSFAFSLQGYAQKLELKKLDSVMEAIKRSAV